MISAGAVALFMVLFLWRSKVYDLSTAMFFAYGLGAMARGKLGLFHALFPLACLNRETTLLLSAVYAVWFWRKMGWGRYMLGGLYQAVIFGAIRFWVMAVYARNPGFVMLIRPMENIRLFVESPWLSIIHWSIFGAVLFLCVRDWRRLPAFMRVVLAVLGPIMMANYLVLGWSFEVRVFAEVYPVIIEIVYIKQQSAVES